MIRKKFVNGVVWIGIGIFIFIVSLEISNYQMRFPPLEAAALIVKIVSYGCITIGAILIVISFIPLEPNK